MEIDLKVEEIIEGTTDLATPLMKGVHEILRTIDDRNDLRNLLKSRLIINQIQLNKQLTS
jgi:hypothetical protein